MRRDSLPLSTAIVFVVATGFWIAYSEPPLDFALLTAAFVGGYSGLVHLSIRFCCRFIAPRLSPVVMLLGTVLLSSAYPALGVFTHPGGRLGEAWGIWWSVQSSVLVVPAVVTLSVLARMAFGKAL